MPSFKPSAVLAANSVQLVLGDLPDIVQKSADEGRLAVVDRAAGDGAQEGAQARCHQKYPSRFFISIEAAESRSMARP